MGISASMKKLFQDKWLFIGLGIIIVAFIAVGALVSNDESLPGSGIDVQIEDCGIRLPDGVECRENTLPAGWYYDSDGVPTPRR